MASIEVLNATQATIEAPVEIQLSLGNPIYRGPKGDPGPAGRDGVIGRDGAQGPKGDTPVKGVDYFTAEDIADFIAQVPAPDLSGYATQTYVENVVRALETGVLKRAIVQSLPVSDIDEYTIYMVPKTGSTGDIYNEYMYLGNDWELIGSTEVDLTNYRKTYYFDTSLDLNQDDIEVLTNLSNYMTNLGQTTTSALPFSIYINGKSIDFVSKYNNNNNLYFTGCLNGMNTWSRDMYIWNPSQIRLTNNGRETIIGDMLDITTANSVVSSYPYNLGANLKYIKNNYVKSSEMPEYLTNSDVLAIWSENNE